MGVCVVCVGECARDKVVLIVTWQTPGGEIDANVGWGSRRRSGHHGHVFKGG